ncbi:2-hydroxychromene-2-carboxylate isomerase [bacterium]|nr:2-hydroxychromene-2-carboxylate isomerase [bacterium]
MAKQVEFFFDYVSPASYLAYTQLPKIAARTNSEIIYKPFLLGGVFKATGNSAPMTVPAKGAWLVRDLELCARKWGVPLTFNQNFPFNTIQVMRGAVWAQKEGNLAAYSELMFGAVWVDNQNIADPETLAELLKTIDIEPTRFMDGIADQTVKDRLRELTDEAVSRGAFGAPTMFVGKEMFWGQDRLEFVEAALAD